jgi:hypothetical protein
VLAGRIKVYTVYAVVAALRNFQIQQFLGCGLPSENFASLSGDIQELAAGGNEFDVTMLTPTPD